MNSINHTWSAISLKFEWLRYESLRGPWNFSFGLVLEFLETPLFQISSTTCWWECILGKFQFFPGISLLYSYTKFSHTAFRAYNKWLTWIHSPNSSIFCLSSSRVVEVWTSKPTRVSISWYFLKHFKSWSPELLFSSLKTWCRVITEPWTWLWKCRYFFCSGACIFNAEARPISGWFNLRNKELAGFGVLLISGCHGYLANVPQNVNICRAQLMIL